MADPVYNGEKCRRFMRNFMVNDLCEQPKRKAQKTEKKTNAGDLNTMNIFKVRPTINLSAYVSGGHIHDILNLNLCVEHHFLFFIFFFFFFFCKTTLFFIYFFLKFEKIKIYQNFSFFFWVGSLPFLVCLWHACTT